MCVRRGGVLVRMGFPLEVAAQVCRKAPCHGFDGSSTTWTVFLILWQGGQLAIDATLVSPLRRDP